MDHSAIKEFRRRLGWTQWDLAEKLGVDQGTVSRWERGVETPRPATAAALRDLILRDDEAITRRVIEAKVVHNPAPACLLDGQARLRLFNDAAKERYRGTYGIDLTTHVGFDFERHCNMMSATRNWEAFRDSGFMRGELLLARFYFNVCGRGHVTEYLPIFEMGRLAGISASIVAHLGFPETTEESIELIEVVYADRPEQIVVIHRGKMSEFAEMR